MNWQEFNNFSIGIEIVNLNGNLLGYSEKQYAALKEVMDHLRSQYEALNSPQRVIGHEQIAGWRGKVDPGVHFDWDRFCEVNFPGEAHPKRDSQCHPEIIDSFQRFLEAMPEDPKASGPYWHAISHAMETSNRLIQKINE